MHERSKGGGDASPNHPEGSDCVAIPEAQEGLFTTDDNGGRPQRLRNRGALEAWLVSDPRHAAGTSMTGTTSPTGATGMSMPAAAGTPGTAAMMGPNALHVHTPRMSIYAGVRKTNDDGEKFIQTNLPLTGTTRFELKGHESVTEGVLTTPAFDDYVPNLRTLWPGHTPEQKADPLYVVAKIIVPHGVLRPRDLVSWDYEGNQPSTVAFMGTGYQGCVANEAVLEVGDDETDEDIYDERKYLSITSDVDLPSQLWPLTKDSKYVDETDPNTLEILITNFTPQRRRGVFWSLHYESLFGALGYTRDPQSYDDTPQYANFLRAATDFDPVEWNLDLKAMDIGYPFPFIKSDGTRMRGLKDKKELAKDGNKVTDDVQEPGTNPRSRRKKPLGAPGGTRPVRIPGKITANDPWSRPICPIGQDSI